MERHFSVLHFACYTDSAQGILLRNRQKIVVVDDFFSQKGAEVLDRGFIAELTNIVFAAIGLSREATV